MFHTPSWKSKDKGEVWAKRSFRDYSTLWRLIGDRVEDSEIATSDHKLIEFGLKINIRGQRRQQYIKNHLKRQDGGDIWRCRATTPKLEKCYTLFKTERACVKAIPSKKRPGSLDKFLISDVLRMCRSLGRSSCLTHTCLRSRWWGTYPTL